MLNLVADAPAQWKAYKPSDAITIQATHDAMRRKAETRTEAFRDVRGIELAKLEAYQTDAALTLRDGHGLNVYSVREHAFSQLCTSIGAPSRYLRTLPTDTALQCLNHGLRKYEGSKRMFRCAGSSVRAIVSERYAELDDVPALFMLAEAAHDRELYLAAWGHSVGTTVGRFVSPKLFDGPDGHPLQIGIDFRNSEVGNHSVSLRSVIFRQVCTNGLIIELGKGAASKWRHIGEASRLQDAFSAMVPTVLTQAEEALYAAAKAHGLVMTVAEARARVGKLLLTENQQTQSITQALAEAGIAEVVDEAQTTITGWHLVNGITSAARIHESEPAMRTAVEAEAGKLLIAA